MAGHKQLWLFSCVLLILCCLAYDGVAQQAPDASNVPAGASPPRPAINWSAAYEPDTLLVRFRPSIAAAVRATVHAEIGATVVQTFDLIPVDVVRLPTGAHIQSIAAAYQSRAEVVYSEPNYIYEAQHHTRLIPDDPRFSEQWALEKIAAPEAWAHQTGSTNVIVAVIDSGIDYDHPDLGGTYGWLNTYLWNNPPEVNGFSGIDEDGNGIYDDIYGASWIAGLGYPDIPANIYDTLSISHGTHVAGIIGAKGNNGLGVAGVNWAVRIMSLKVINDGGSLSTADAIAALQYAVNKGAHVINLSWGNGPYSQLLKDAIETTGRLVVAAAGNNTVDNDGPTPNYPSSYNSSNIIAVACSTSTDSLCWFSNYGRTSVDLAAPGEGILSILRGIPYTLPSLGLLSGTSMSAPHVSGVAALLLAQVPGASVAQLRQWILDGADPLPALADKMVTGGRLNAAKALLLPTRLTVTVAGAGAGRGTVRSSQPDIHGRSITCSTGSTCTRPYPESSAVDLTATADSGSLFVGWNGPDCSGTQPTVRITMSMGKICTATFRQQVIFDLGTLGGYNSRALSINATGQVVGESDTADGSRHAFLWAPGSGMIDLRTLPGGTSSVAYGINPAGQVVGSSDNASGAPRAFLWDKGVMTDLDILGRPFNQANDINAAGQVVGLSSTNVHGLAFLWHNGATTILWGWLGAQPEALGINDMGQVVGYRVAPIASYAVRWENGLMTDLGVLLGYESGARATDINNAGQVVGTAWNNHQSRAFRWHNGVMADLGTLPGGTSSQAHGINNLGQVVGMASDASGAWRAVLWDNDGVITDLNSLLPTDSGWELTEAYDINDDRQIVGTGVINRISRRAFRLSLSEAPSPHNSPPIADSQAVTTGTEMPIMITLTGHDTNDYPLTFDLVSAPIHGTLSGLDAEIGIVTYTPGAGFLGTDSFSFTANNGIVDSDPAIVTLTVVPISDFIVASLAAPSTTGAGAILTVTDTTKNQGGSSAWASTTTLYLSTNASLDAADIVLGSRVVPALAAGTTHTDAISVTIPPTTAPGTYYLIAQADAAHAVPETRESNNKKTRSIFIGPDLSVSALSAPVRTGAGATITITDTTKNQGGNGASSATTRFYLSTDTTIDAGDLLLGSRATPALTAGATSSGAVAVTIPPGTARGTYYLIAKADADDVVVEAHENNNIKSRTITVR